MVVLWIQAACSEYSMERSSLMDTILIGLISDTHGLVRPELVRELSGVQRILHAGDIGGSRILAELNSIAPVTPVRGNIDKGSWAGAIPRSDVVELTPGISVYLLHDIHRLDLDPRSAGYAAVICGHSHQPSISEKDGVLYLNPGSAGPRRFSLPVSIMRLEIAGPRLIPKLVTFSVSY